MEDSNKPDREALLIEYQQLDEVAANESRSLMTLTGLVTSGWILGLGFALQMKPEVFAIVASGIGGLGAVATNIALVVHRDRQLCMRKLMFARQRQIERKYGMYKSRNAQLISDPEKTIDEMLANADSEQAEIIEEMRGSKGRRELSDNFFDYPFFYLIVPTLWLLATVYHAWKVYG